MGERRGIFIAFEGGELLGKSTQFHLAISRLNELFPEHSIQKYPREPGGCSIGEFARYAILNPDVLARMVRIIRHLKVNPKHTSSQFQEDFEEVKTQLDRSKKFMDFSFDVDIHPLTEAFLFQVSRAQVRAEIVLPLLEKGKIAIIDRSGYSSDVYQGIVRGLGVPWIESLNEVSEQGRRPDLVITFCIDPEKGVELLRSSTRTHKRDRLDMETIEFHRKVFQGYIDLPKLLPKKLAKTFKVIDFGKYMHLPKELSIAKQHEEIMGHIIDCIKDKRHRLNP